MIGSSEASKTRWTGPAVAVLVVGLWSVGMQSALGQCPCVDEASGFGGGDGSEADPYQVCTPEHLDNVRNHLSSYFVQTGDIDMTGVVFLPIGDDANRFEGTYDGLGFTIANLTIDLPETDDVGLFAVIEAGSEVRNANLVDVFVSGRNRVCGLVGTNHGLIDASSTSGIIEGEVWVGGISGHNEGLIHKSSSDVLVDYMGDGESLGGLIGVNWGGQINSSFSSGAVAGLNNVGGLAGTSNNGGSIHNSYSLASVSGNLILGGLTGGSYNSIIENSYAQGGVSGNDYIGGLAGVIDNSTVTNSCSAGSVSGGGTGIGGLIGFQLSDVTVSSSFWDIETSGQTESAGGVGMTTAEMMTQSTFDPPWDFVDVWSIDEGNDYPRLQWESEPIEPPTLPDCDEDGVFDICEPDCNDNDIPDDCDIADGTAEDCNENEIPDECDIATGDSVDCNANGIPDECEEFCEGDVNCDGAIDPLDSGYVLARFGCPVGTGDPDCDVADANDDGAVNPLDSGFVLARFGQCQ